MPFKSQAGGGTPLPETPKPPKTAVPAEPTTRAPWDSAPGPPPAPGTVINQGPGMSYTVPQPNAGARIAAIPPRFWQTQPVVTGYLTTDSSLSDDEVAGLGHGLDEVQAWVDSSNTFAGQPGALTSMRAKIADIQDPLIKKEAQDLLRNLLAMPPENQTALMAYLRGQTGDPVATGMGTMAGGLTEATQQAAEALISGVGGEAHATQQGVELANEKASVGVLAALKVMFPEVTATIGDNLYSWQGLDETVNELNNNAYHWRENMSDYIYNNSSAVRRMTELAYEGIVRVAEEGAIKGTYHNFQQMFFPLIGSLSSAGAEIGFSVGGDVGRQIGAEGIVAKVAAEAEGAQNVMGQKLLEGGHGTFGWIPGLNYGLDANDPEYQEKLEQRGGAFALILMGAAGALGNVGKRLKIARSVPNVAIDKAAAAAQGIVARSTAEAALAARRSVRTGGILGTAAEVVKMPLRKLTEQIDKQAMRFARDPEKWLQQGFHGHNGTRLVKRFMQAKKVHTTFEGQLGFVQDAYGTSWLTPELATKVLAETTEDGMRRAFVKGLTEAATPATRLTSRRTALVARAAEIAAERKTAKEAGATVHPDAGNFDVSKAVDGQIIDVPARDVVDLLDFPERAVVTRGAGGTAAPKELGKFADASHPIAPDSTGRYGNMSADEFAALVEDVRVNGVREPITIEYHQASGKGSIADGYHRLAAAREAGRTDVPFVVKRVPKAGPGDVPMRAFVEKLEAPTMRGKTAEEVADLREGLKKGYDPTTPNRLAESGEVGHIEVEYNPDTNVMHIPEGHRRIGILADEGKNIPLRVRIKKGYTSVGRVVPAAEKLAISERGARFLERLYQRHRVDFVDINEGVIRKAYESIKTKYGGVSIDANQGKIVKQTEGYAAGIVPNDQTITLPIEEALKPGPFKTAFNRAQEKFRPLLERQDVVLGVFRDDEKGIVTFEPSTVVPDAAEAEAIVTHLNADGGAFHLTGDEKNIMPVQIEAQAPKAIPQSVDDAVTGVVREAANRHLGGEALKGEADRIKLELKSINKQLANEPTPILTFPKRGTIRAGIRAPSTRIEKFIHAVGTGKFRDLAKFVDELPKFPELYVPGTFNNPIDWKARNVDTISRYLRAAGVDSKTVQIRIGEMLAVKNQQDFFRLLEHKVFGESGDIDRALNRFKIGVDPAIRQRLIRLHDSPIEGRTRRYQHEMVDTPGGPESVARPIVREQVRPGEYRPKPSAPSQYLQQLRLPDVDMLMQANSFVERLAARGRAGAVDLPKLRPDASGAAKARQLVGRGVNFTGKAIIRTTYDLPKFALNLSTMILKPAVMVMRLPAMIMRIQMEQMLRAHEFGYKVGGVAKGIALAPGGIPIPMTQVRLFKGLFGEEGWNLLAPDPKLVGREIAPDASEVGMMMSELSDGGKVEHRPIGTAEMRTGEMEVKGEHYRGWAEDNAQLHDDWMWREFVARDLDRDSILRWLDEDERASQFMHDMHDQTLRESYGKDGGPMSREEWVDRTIDSIKQQTGENPLTLEAIRTGRARPLEHTQVAPDTLPDGRNVADTYNDLVDEVKGIEEEIRTRYNKPESVRPGYTHEQNDLDIAVMAEQRRLKLKKIAHLRDEYGEQVLRGNTGVRLADRKAYARYLKKQHQENGWEMPQTITVERHSYSANHDAGILDTNREAGRAMSNALYKPFTALSKADMKGTRGSLFGQVFERRETELLARGYAPNEAAAYARAYAAETTKDIMYDLSAKTGAQRSVKNLMWFAPAWQEVMYTWGVKIPSQSYWPLGAANLVVKYVVAKRLLTDIGVISKNARGEDVITVPGLAPVIHKLTGFHVPEDVFGKVSGLNLVTSGGGVGGPGLSTAAGFALGQAAIRKGGIFKDLSKVLQPYGPEVSLLPAPIVNLWEVTFGTPAPFEFLSPELQKRRHDEAYDAAVQYAYADLKHRGIVPPLPEAYGTKEADGTWTLSKPKELEYQKASNLYLAQLRSTAENYASGISVVKLLGSTVAPMSLYATNEDKDAWVSFFNEVIAPQGFGSDGMSDQQKNQIDAFLNDHPYSTSFSIFYNEYGEKQRDSAFSSPGDEDFYASYYTGERKIMSGEDYTLKVQAIESLRHYQEVTNAALDKISPGRDPWVLLTHGWEKSGAMQANKEAWDRWRYLNKDAAAMLDATKANWIEAKNVPQLSFEAERIGNVIDGMLQIAPMLTGEESYRSGAMREVIGKFKEARGLYSDEFGAPNTPTEKAMDWWGTNVLEPYFAATDSLYQNAQDAEAAGLSASSYWNAIRAEANRTPPMYKGKAVPSVEEMFFGNRSPHERDMAVLKWQTRPMTWLSNFQLDKAWGSQTPEVRTFLSDAADWDQQFWDQVQTAGIAPGSRESDALKQYRYETLLAAAQKAGPAAVEAFQLSESAPAVRLNAQGFGAGNLAWSQTLDTANQITSGLTAAGLSAKGTSEQAVAVKLWLYSAIETARQENGGDNEFNKMWNDLSEIMPLPNGVPRQHALLYESILFGNFNDRIPYELAAVGGTG